ncbi:MAG: uL30 family ribosomal protein [Candidatus Woesearchaeota archaeon]|nr:uL30 family ribosomal protein [Candidatus Woesearchaeota archaeon]
MSSEKTVKPSEGNGEMLAVVLIRGLIDLRYDMLTTLKMLRLHKKHSCVIVPKNAVNLGMINKVKDFVAWGEIDGPTLKMLIEKRAEKSPRDPKKTKPFFRLSPPRKGFGRRGLKGSFKQGGALGYRGDKINDLITRML